MTSGGVTLIVLAISSACGYALSQIEFTGRKVLWAVIIASFMIPVQALIVNHFFLMYQWGLLNSWLGVILPQLIAPVAVIVYKQFFDGVPTEFRDARRSTARATGRSFSPIFLPMNWGVTTALGIIIFIAAWNAFLWPFLAITRTEWMNVTVGRDAVPAGRAQRSDGGGAVRAAGRDPLSGVPEAGVGGDQLFGGDQGLGALNRCG